MSIPDACPHRGSRAGPSIHRPLAMPACDVAIVFILVCLLRCCRRRFVPQCWRGCKSGASGLSYQGCSMHSTEAPVGQGLESSESGGVSGLTEGAGSVTAQHIVGEAA